MKVAILADNMLQTMEETVLADTANIFFGVGDSWISL